MAKGKVKSDDAPKVGNNPFNDPFTEEMIERHEALDAECEEIMLAAMRECKPKRESQRELLTEAKERGMNAKALRAHLKERKLEVRKVAIREKLPEEDQDSLDLLKQYLGQLEGTPLGDAALKDAKAAGSA